MIIRDLGGGFYLQLCSLGVQFEPFWELKERRRFWFDKMWAWSMDADKLEALCRRIKYNRTHPIN